MTDQELIDLVQQKAPEDLSAEEIELLRKRLADSPKLREVLFGQLQMESYLAAALSPPAVSVDDILRRARREDSPAAHPVQTFLVIASSAILLAVVVGVFFAAWRVRPGADRAEVAQKNNNGAASDAGKQEDPNSKNDVAKPPDDGSGDSSKPEAVSTDKGKLVVATSLPVTIEAENFARGNVKVDATEWGSAEVTVIRTGEQPAFAEYEVELPAAGKHSLRVKYASFDSRPLRLSINGQLQPQLVAGEQTGGHAVSSQKWFPAGEFEFQKGKNVLRLETTANFPHLDQLEIGPAGSIAAAPGSKPAGLAEKVAPWREVLDRPGDPPTFAEVCFENFRTEKSLPQRDDLHRWFAPIEGQRYRVYDNRTKLGQCAAFEGLIRLKAPWQNDSALKVSLENYDKLQLHFFAGESGVTLVYYESDFYRWAAYATTRKPNSPRPDKFVLVATDEGRNRRSEIRFGGPLELRHHNGEMILSRGDVVLLRAPLAQPPQEAYFDGRASFHGLAFVRTQDFPPADPPRPTTTEIARPADLPWVKELKAGGHVQTTPEGAIELRADSTAEKGYVATPLPKAAVQEVVLEVDEASPGASVFLGRANGQPQEVLRFTKNQRDGGLCLAMHPGDDAREADFGAPPERLTPSCSSHVWVKLLLGPGTLRWWMSPDGQHWVQPEYPTSGLAGGITHVGLQYVPQARDCRIRLKRIELRELPEFAALAPPELRDAAPVLNTAPTFDEWLTLADKAKPATADASAWRRACAARSLGAGCAFELGWRIVLAVLDDAAARNLPLDQQLHLLDEAVLLCDQRANDVVSGNLFTRYPQAGLAAFDERGTRPFTSIRHPVMTAPFNNQSNLNIRQTCEGAIRAELVQLLHNGQWEETLRFCERLRFYKQDDQLPLVEFAEFTARRNSPLRVGAETIGRQREEWKHPYSEQLNKEAYNLLAELQAVLESDAFADAARMITSLDPTAITGVTPQGADRELYVSLSAAVRLALRAHPDLVGLVREKYGPLAQLRIKSAIAENNAAAVQLAAVQFESTEAAAEAHRWLGDRALSAGWFGRALAEYRRAETTAEASVRDDLANRMRLAAAMLGEDAGSPATRTVQFGETRLAPAEFETLVAEMKRRANTTERIATSQAASLTSAAPPPTGLEVQRRSRFEGPIGENPAAEVTRNTNRHKVDWVDRQLATAIDADELYVSNRFQLAAYNLADGQLKWRGLPPPGKMLRSQDWSFTPMRPLVTPRHVIARQLFGSGPTLACFDKNTGHYLWSSEQRQNEYLVSDPLWVQEQLVCLTLARQDQRENLLRLSIFDSESGDILAQYPLVDLRESWWQRRVCEIAAVDDGVVASLGGLVVCADLSGNVRWVRRQAAMPAEEDSTWVQQTYDRPLVFDKRVYVAQPGVRAVDCLDPETGFRHWSAVLSGVQRLIGIADGRLIVQTERDLRALDPKTGARLWTHDAPDLLYPIGCGGPGGLVYARREPTDATAKTFRPRLVWLDPATGQARGSAPLAGLEDPDPRLGPLVWHNGHLFTFFGRGLVDANRDVVELIAKGEAEKTASPGGRPDAWTGK